MDGWNLRVLMRGRCCRVHYNQIGILEAKNDLPFPKNKKGLTVPTLSLRKLSKMRDNRGARDLRLWSFPLSQHLVCYSYVPRPPASSTGQRHRLSVRDRLPSFSVSLSPSPQPQIRPFPPPPPPSSASSSSSPLSPVSHDPGRRLSVVLASRPLH